MERGMKHVKDMVAAANQEIDCVTAEDAIGLLDDPETVFVDLRDPRELTRDGKIPGAFHCPRGMLEFWVDPESPYAKPIFQEEKRFLFYCASGWRSALSTKTVQDMGLPRASHIVSGFGGWKAAGGPVETPD
jgi:rhodanese-related sulfurtransferase